MDEITMINRAAPPMAGNAPEAAPFVETLSPEPATITKDRLTDWNKRLNEYKAGKASIDRRIRNSERWWKMRNDEAALPETDPKAGGFRSKTAWLHNVIVSKHADAVEAYPTPNILPREQDDKTEAWALGKIIPVILEQNHFEETYDLAMYEKLKFGACCYKVMWDSRKLNGLGDIAIELVSLLNLFWEPGIRDIQKSSMVFHVEMMDKDELKEEYPDKLDGKNINTAFIPAKPLTDDNVSTADKAAVIDVYYKVKGKIHYCKYVGDTVLYASEEDASMRDGYYKHGKFPFVIDRLFPVEGSPAGYGFVDICSNAQIGIDLMDTAIVRNTVAVATPRYFLRMDSGVNEEEFINIDSAVVHTTGNLGEDSIRVIDARQLSGNYISAEQQKITELRETSGNTETATGTAQSGVTAASAIAALQEASGKGSRAATAAAYRAYAKVVEMVIELIRQYYNLPRQFRVLGNMGVERFITFSSAGMQPQPQGMLGGQDMGVRIPVYDIKVVPEKQNKYTKVAQNELAKELYALHIFDPQNVNQALMCLEMMDFDGKEELMQRVSTNGTLYQQLEQYKQIAVALAAQYKPELVQGLMMGGAIGTGGSMSMQQALSTGKGGQEIAQVRNARQRATEASQPGGAA